MIAIRNGAAVVEVSPESCGALTRFAWSLPGRTIDWLRPASSDAVARAFPQDMACFPCVPFSNRIRDGKFEFSGRTISLPPNFPPEPHAIHGDGWHARWDVIAHNESRAVIEYVHAPNGWPFPYHARQTFRLEAQALVLEMSVKNDGDAPMPLGFAFHPYFIRTPGVRLKTSAAAMWTNDAQSMPAELVDPPNLDGLDPSAVRLDNNFIGWSGRARIDWPEWRASLEMRAEGPFACFVIYTPPGERYFCAEPATNCIDAFNLAAQGRRDTGMLVIGPGEELGGRVHLVPSLAG